MKRMLAVLLLLLPNLLFAQDEAAPFEDTDCFFELPNGYEAGEDVLCGYVTVPEQHTNPDNTNSIRLAVVVIKSTSNDPAPDPLVLAQGGPGGSTIDFFGGTLFTLLTPILEEYLQDRDLVLIEQRGTQYSQPDLLCEESFEYGLENADVILPPDEADAISQELQFECRDRLVEEGVNLSAYNSVENAADIPVVMTALGYDRFSFYGVSYGTILGQHLMRDHGDRLNAVILDANVPLSVNFLPIVPQNADRAFRLLFDSCAADDACNSVFPDLETVFFEQVARLNADPVLLPIANSETGEEVEVAFNGDALLGLLFQSLYSTPLIPQLPGYIYGIAQDDYVWAQLIYPEILFEITIAQGMYNSVMCAEDGDYTAEDVNLDALYPDIQRVFGPQSATFPAFCEQWGAAALDSYVDDPVVSDIPTLILSGEFDPITPSVGGDVIAETLSNAYVYTVPGQGHGSLLIDLCPIGIMIDFLADPASEPDADCLSEMGVEFRLPASSEIDLETVTIAPYGVTTVRPSAWTEAAPGVYLTEDQTTALLIVALPGDDLEVAVNQLNSSFGLGDVTPGDDIEAGGRTWATYVLEVQGLRILFAAYTEGGQTYLVLLQSPLQDFDTIFDAVLIPALENFVIE